MPLRKADEECSLVYHDLAHILNDCGCKPIRMRVLVETKFYARTREIIERAFLDLFSNCAISTGLTDSRFLECSFLGLVIRALCRAVKNCKADDISRRLAGYWEKFSISNNRTSVRPHWLR